MNKFTVKIPNGYLVVEEKGSENEYPGVYVSFSKDGKETYGEHMIACVEYNSDSGEIKTETYVKDCEEPTNIVSWEEEYDERF